MLSCMWLPLLQCSKSHQQDHLCQVGCALGGNSTHDSTEQQEVSHASQGIVLRPGCPLPSAGQHPLVVLLVLLATAQCSLPRSIWHRHAGSGSGSSHYWSGQSRAGSAPAMLPAYAICSTHVLSCMLRPEAQQHMLYSLCCRIQYKFDKLTISIGGLQLTLPPVGGGWTEAVFCDDELRVMQNSRGDTLVLQRLSGKGTLLG